MHTVTSCLALLCLHSGGADEFLYTRQGQSPVIDGVDDTKELGSTRQAFALLGNMRLLLSIHMRCGRRCTLSRRRTAFTHSACSCMHAALMFALVCRY